MSDTIPGPNGYGRQRTGFSFRTAQNGQNFLPVWKDEQVGLLLANMESGVWDSLRNIAWHLYRGRSIAAAVPKMNGKVYLFQVETPWPRDQPGVPGMTSGPSLECLDDTRQAHLTHRILLQKFGIGLWAGGCVPIDRHFWIGPALPIEEPDQASPHEPGGGAAKAISRVIQSRHMRQGMRGLHWPCTADQGRGGDAALQGVGTGECIRSAPRVTRNCKSLSTQAVGAVKNIPRHIQERAILMTVGQPIARPIYADQTRTCFGGELIRGPEETRPPDPMKKKIGRPCRSPYSAHMSFRPPC